MVCKTVTLKKLLNSCPLMGKISELFKKSQSCSNIKKRNFQIFFRFRSIKNDINFINFESVKLFKCKVFFTT
uniref:Uncharacterized protein n=1 Tax=Amorphochlora amoebiformis TaxID=1561963 RepID=A0A0H5BKI5_9EUKA|nr:hypothetical protein [Amorphochlora amoebiformis]